MNQRSLARIAALALVASVCLRLPPASRGDTPPTAVDLAPLIRALGDPAERVRFRAMAELLRIGRPATRALANLLLETKPIADTRGVSRAELAFSVLRIAPDVDVDALLDTYRSAPVEPKPSEHTVNWVETPRQRVLALLGGWAAKPTERVYEAFTGDDPMLRASLAGMLGRAGPEASRAVPLLAEAVAKDGDAEVQIAAASALALIPDSGSKALRRLMGNSDPKIRAITLAAYPANSKDSAVLVARLLRDPVSEVRTEALKRIWNRGLSRKTDDLKNYSWHYPCLVVGDENPGSALLVGLPNSAISDLVVLAWQGEQRMRWLAFQALGSLACHRRDLTPIAVEALVKMVSDPAEEVGTQALDRLARLSEHRFVPSSAELLDKLLHGLSDPIDKMERHDLILAIMENLDLPESRRNEIVDALVAVCLSEEQSCERVRAVLSTRPAWQETWVEALASQPHKCTSEVLIGLWDVHSLPTTLLERLLGHWQRTLRIRAAVALAECGYAPDRIWNLLEEGIRSFRTEAAAQALASFGELGIAKIIAVIEDPETLPLVRRNLIGELSKLSTVSPQATDFLLTLPTSDMDTDSLVAAIREVSLLKSRPADVKPVLEKAFATADDEARRRVLWAWEETGQAPEVLVARAFSDPAPRVREGAFRLLSALPVEDPRRLAFTTAALQDEDKNVREAALAFAGELGEPGAALLARYATEGEPLTLGFFMGVGRLDCLGEELASTLDVLAAHERGPDHLLSILGRAGAEAPYSRKRLYELLDAPDLKSLELASQGLLTLHEDPWARGGRLAAALTDVGIQRIFKAEPDNLFGLPKNSFTEPPKEVTLRSRIAWPPPAGYRREVVPRKLLGATERTTLGDVYQRLVGSLEAVSHGFEHGLFLGPTDGFVLVARMERVKLDGTPLPEPARWMKKGSPKLSLVDILTDLFFESPGYFRIIVFAVTSDLVPGESKGAVLPEPRDGFPMLWDYLTALPFQGKEVLALVYSYERQGDAKVKPWEDGAPSALQHLEKSGVWSRLGGAVRH